MSDVVRLEYAYGVCPKCKRVHCLRYLIHNDGLIHKPYELKCINCNSYFTKEDVLGSGEETAPKPITNADRIRAMSDEELTAWIETFAPSGTFQFWLNGKTWLQWLRQEAGRDERAD